MRFRESLLVAGTAAVVAGFLLPVLVFPNVPGAPFDVSLADWAAGRTVDVQIHDTYVLLGGGATAWVSLALATCTVGTLALVVAGRRRTALAACAVAAGCAAWLFFGLAPPAHSDAVEASAGWTGFPPLSAYNLPLPAVAIERGWAVWSHLGAGLVLVAGAAALTRRDASRR